MLTDDELNAMISAWGDQGPHVNITDLCRDVARSQEAAERERCADLCDGVAAVCADSSEGVRKAASMAAAKSCARLIRGD